MSVKFPRFDEKGEVDGLVGISHEITNRKRREGQLRESQQKYKALIETTGDFVWEIDPDGRYTYCSPQMEKLWGMKPSDMIGRSPFDMMPPEAREDGVKFFKSLVASQKPFNGIQVPSLDGQGKPIYIEISGVPFFDDKGKLLGYRGITRDITERKKAEETMRETEEQFRRAIQDAPIPVIMHAEDGQVLQVSHTWTELTGYKINQIRSFDEWITQAVYGGGADKVRDHLHELFKGNRRSIDVEFAVRTADGRERFWSFSASSPGTLRDGRRFVVGMALDVTERRKTMRNLKHARDVSRRRAADLELLQVKLEEKAAEVEEYATQMEQLAKERLLKLKDAERLAAIGATAGMVGHDIRNPLQSILSELYLAKSELPRIERADVKNNLAESIAGIEGEIEYINKIVQDLQDYARPVTPVAREFNLRELCREVLKKTHASGNVRKFCVVEDEAKQAVTDPEVLRRILGNLVMNAVQSMPDGGIVTVRARREKEATVVVVEDTGEGIPEAVRPKLFTPLFTTKSKGQGFGLAATKRLVEALGGSVCFESEVGKGTIFIVRLPLNGSNNGKNAK